MHLSGHFASIRKEEASKVLHLNDVSSRQRSLVIHSHSFLLHPDVRMSRHCFNHCSYYVLRHLRLSDQPDNLPHLPPSVPIQMDASCLLHQQFLHHHGTRLQFAHYQLLRSGILPSLWQSWSHPFGLDLQFSSMGEISLRNLQIWRRKGFE